LISACKGIPAHFAIAYGWNFSIDKFVVALFYNKYHLALIN
jgi:hypothetical protein